MRDQLAVSSEQLAVSYRQFANASQQVGSFVFYLFLIQNVWHRTMK